MRTPAFKQGSRLMTLQLLALLVAAQTQIGDATTDHAKTDRFLMSVGINKYDNLQGFQLYGAVNDVDLMVESLVPLGFEAVCTLKDDEAVGDAIRAGWAKVLTRLDGRPEG